MLQQTELTKSQQHSTTFAAAQHQHNNSTTPPQQQDSSSFTTPSQQRVQLLYSHQTKTKPLLKLKLYALSIEHACFQSSKQYPGTALIRFSQVNAGSTKAPKLNYGYQPQQVLSCKRSLGSRRRQLTTMLI
ncbi:MAG: hypothetical protein EOP56_13095 [Sphingobacteriales bacterium]|nr:MAG: hypothetical protein EOP56_13095 [Sphingobacteriales bacterium]